MTWYIESKGQRQGPYKTENEARDAAERMVINTDDYVDGYCLGWTIRPKREVEYIYPEIGHA